MKRTTCHLLAALLMKLLMNLLLWTPLPAASASASTTQTSPVPDTTAQRALACTACHRAQDQETPGGYVPRIAGKPAGYLLEQMQNFRDGRRAHDTMARLMQNLDDRFLAELAGYFAAQAPSLRSTGAAPVDAGQAQRAQ